MIKIKSVKLIQLSNPVEVYDITTKNSTFCLTGGEVVHNSKDVSDAVAGAIYNLSLMKSSYQINSSEIGRIVPDRGVNYIQPEIIEKSRRVSTGRVSFYKRRLR